MPGPWNLWVALVIRVLLRVIYLGTILSAVTSVMAAPLRVHPENPRFFSDAGGKVVYLTGAHTWTSLVDRSDHPAFDFPAYLEYLRHYNHNFTRMWTWEHAV